MIRTVKHVNLIANAILVTVNLVSVVILAVSVVAIVLKGVVRCKKKTVMTTT